MIRAVIFDLDGTLIATEQLKAESYARAAIQLKPSAFSKAEAISAFEDFVGGSREEVSKGLLYRFGLESAARARMVEFAASEPWQVYTRLRLRIFEEIIADEAVLKQAAWEHNVELLRTVRSENCRLGLATMSYCPQVERSLHALELENAFDFIATREDVENPKPDPEIYLLVARALGFRPAECMVVEDSVAGVRAGLAAGTLVLAVATPLTRRNLHESKLLDDHHIVDRPEDLQETIAHLIAHHNANHAG
ncbi:MAG: HAD family phosphatase [Anaerolineae bacterium]|nr:HAD family phosphatase [Anaerolineae bacterium]MCI0611216.1 HAD family phosphatase [Anaerolineae bacterium]